MSKRGRKPCLSLASAMHRVSGSSVVASIVPAGSVVGRKRKRSSAALISAFHQLQRKQDDLAAAKQAGKLTAAAHSAQAAELAAELASLGGLEAYQSLSIAGHSARRFAAFNTAHWIVDTLADAGLGLQSLKGRHAESGSSTGVNATIGGSAPTADEKKLAKRNKERERKRARKRAKKEQEEEEAKQAAKATKGGKGKKAAPAAKQVAKEESEDEAASDDEAPAGGEEEDETQEEGCAPAGAVSSMPLPVFSPQNRMRLLDVGAITNHYLSYASHIACEAIDLNPQHPSVRKQDFFEMDHSKTSPLRGAYDAVVLSLVLNFVGERFRRGEMIKQSAALLKATGHARFFIVLPSACLKNSRWMTHETFVEKCMRPLGLALGKFKYTTKLALFEFVREEAKEEEAEPEPEVVAEAAAEEDAEMVDEDGKKVAAAPKAASAAPKKPKKKGFQPAGVVLAGETRNNFSIAWRAD